MATKLPKVSLEDRIPRQIKTPLSLRKRCDFWESQGWKYSAKVECHSYAEYLAAGILEIDPNVRHYTPQPLRFRVGSTWYVPDFWFQDYKGREFLWELKPNAEFNEAWREALSQYCQDLFIDFHVMANEAFTSQEQRALNAWWLIRWRNQYSEWPTHALESKDYLSLLGEGSRFGEGMWESYQRKDIPLLTSYLDGLLSGKLRCEWNNPIGWNTRLGLA